MPLGAKEENGEGMVMALSILSNMFLPCERNRVRHMDIQFTEWELLGKD